MSCTEAAPKNAPKMGCTEAVPSRARPTYGGDTNFGASVHGAPERTEAWSSPSVRTNFSAVQTETEQEAPVWPFGTGGNCGPAFAETRAGMVADMDRLGVRGAHELWTATKRIEPAVAQVLTERDWERMQRAYVGGGA